MSDVKWIKITTDMFDDEKIKLIESMPDKDSILIIWIKLLTLAGKTNANGYIFLTANIPYTAEMLSAVFNRPLNTIRMAFETFKNFGMIEIDDKNLIHITNWGKHQNVNGLEKIREKERLRKQKQRQLAKTLILKEGENVTGQSRDSHGTVTLSSYSSSSSYSNSNSISKDNVISNSGNSEKKPKKKNKKKSDSACNQTQAGDSETVKKQYDEFVTMTEKQYAALVDEMGEAGAKWCIETLSNYKGSKKAKYESDYHAIKSWVVHRYEEEQQKKRTRSMPKAFASLHEYMTEDEGAL